MEFVNFIKIYKQQIFVVVAFTTMVLVSCLFVNSIVKEQNRNYSKGIVEQAELNIRNRLAEAENTLDNIVMIVEDTYWTETSSQEIQDMLVLWSRKIIERPESMPSFLSVYGYVNGAYVDGEEWIPPEDYNPIDRPWYSGAVQNEGKVFYTEPYIDAMTGAVVVSLSKEFYDSTGESVGVLSVDMDASLVADYISNLNLNDDGFGMLISSDMTILAHKDASLVGMDLLDFYGYSQIFEQLRTEGHVFDVPIINYDGTPCVIYISSLLNQWYLAVVTPSSAYYRNVYIITIVMTFLAFVLSCVLCFILARINKERNRSEQENLSKTSFLARISHEIRTPMNAIAGMSELMLRKDIPPDIYENVINIKNASDNLLSIINDILDYSKMESGKLEVVQSNYLFASLINDIIGIIRMRVMDKPIQFVANIDSAIPHELIGDEARVRQVLLNILSNAVKYTNEGSVSITAMAEINEDTKTAVIVFEISDSGAGIKDENIGKIFGDFVKLDIDSARIIPGTGLGLTITKSLCVAMGGDITVYSKYGEGSTFTVTIPQKFNEYRRFATVVDAHAKAALVYEPRLKYASSIVCSIDNLNVRCTYAVDQSMFYNELKQNKYQYVFVSSFMLDSARDILKRLMLDATLVLLAEHNEPLSIPNVKVVAMPVHALSIADILNDTPDAFAYNYSRESYISFVAPKARVLVVDDIKTNLQVAEGLMAPYKMTIDTALSGAEAIEMCKVNNYDLVFMDHMMPEMDGIEATHLIRGLNDGSGDFTKIPIVALTANAMAGMKDKFIHNGMDDFLAKPIELSKLNAILETWIPRNMRERYVKDSIETTTEDSEKAIEVPGLDTKKGLIMTGGSWKSYVKTLTIYYYDVKQKLTEINQKLEEGDISSYTTFVHALKSASGSIGAADVSAAAAALEDAAKNGNMLYIGEHNDKFLKMLEELILSIEIAIMGSSKESDGGAVENDIPLLHEALDKLKIALDEMDMGAIDDFIAKLESKDWEKDISDGIEKISQCILLFEYDNAIEIIDDIISKYIE